MEIVSVLALRAADLAALNNTGYSTMQCRSEGSPRTGEKREKNCYLQCARIGGYGGGYILKEMGFEEIRPTFVSRTGKSEKFPKQIPVTHRTTQDCERITKKCRDGPARADGIFVTRDHTFNQRQEAKLFRVKEEKNGMPYPEKEEDHADYLRAGEALGGEEEEGAGGRTPAREDAQTAKTG